MAPRAKLRQHGRQRPERGGHGAMHARNPMQGRVSAQQKTLASPQTHHARPIRTRPDPTTPAHNPQPQRKAAGASNPKANCINAPPNPQRKEQELAQGTPENTSHPVNLAPETAPMQKSQTQAHNFYYSRHAPRHLPTPTCATFPTNFVVTYHGR